MIGIDYKIDVLKAVFDASLFTSVADNTYTPYGRAFINNKEFDMTIPEVLISGTNEYKPVKFDDKLDGISFMVVRNDVIGDTYVDMKADVDIYFAVNLNKLYPSVSERAVEYLHKDVLELLSDSEFEFVSYTQGYDAFSEFTNVKPSDNMQPYYLVKFTTRVEFQINENIKC